MIPIAIIYVKLHIDCMENGKETQGTSTIKNIESITKSDASNKVRYL